MRIRPPKWQQVKQLSAPYWLAPRVMGELIRHVGDSDLEKRFGLPVVERLLFAAMTRSYDAGAADGFRGLIAFELTRPASGRDSSWWTVRVDEEGATARPGRPEQLSEAALRARVPVADLLRIAGGVIDPVEPVLAGRAAVSGDLGVAARLAEMFGAPRVR